MSVFTEYYGQRKEITLRCKTDEKQILNRFRKMVESESPKTFDVDIDKNAHDLGWLFKRAMRQRMKRMKFDFMIPNFKTEFSVANDFTILKFAVDPSRMPVYTIIGLLVGVGLFIAIMGAAVAGESEAVYGLLIPYLLFIGPSVQTIRMCTTWQKRADKLFNNLLASADGKVINEQIV